MKSRKSSQQLIDVWEESPLSPPNGGRRYPNGRNGHHSAHPSISDLINQFIDDVCAGKLNETPVAYRGKLQRLIQFFGAEQDARSLTSDDLDRFKHHLLSRKTKLRGTKTVKGLLSPFTTHTVLVTVKFFFRWAVEKGHIEANPAVGIKLQKPPKPKPKAIDALTVDQLLKAATKMGRPWEQARNIALILVLRDTGGRVGGLVTANFADLDLKKQRLQVFS